LRNTDAFAARFRRLRRVVNLVVGISLWVK